MRQRAYPSTRLRALPSADSDPVPRFDRSHPLTTTPRRAPQRAPDHRRPDRSRRPSFRTSTGALRPPRTPEFHNSLIRKTSPRIYRELSDKPGSPHPEPGHHPGIEDVSNHASALRIRYQLQKQDQPEPLVSEFRLASTSRPVTHGLTCGGAFFVQRVGPAGIPKADFSVPLSCDRAGSHA
jgi:hypothetical protein